MQMVKVLSTWVEPLEQLMAALSNLIGWLTLQFYNWFRPLWLVLGPLCGLAARVGGSALSSVAPLYRVGSSVASAGSKVLFSVLQPVLRLFQALARPFVAFMQLLRDVFGPALNKVGATTLSCGNCAGPVHAQSAERTIRCDAGGVLRKISGLKPMNEQAAMKKKLSETVAGMVKIKESVVHTAAEAGPIVKEMETKAEGKTSNSKLPKYRE